MFNMLGTDGVLLMLLATSALVLAKPGDKARSSMERKLHGK